MNKKRKNLIPQIMAWLALFAIVASIIGTWILVLFSWWEESSYGHSSDTQVLDQADLQRIIDEASIEVTANESATDIETITEEVITASWTLAE